MNNPEWILKDNLDDRREVYRMLDHPKMTDNLRLAFISRCAVAASDPLLKMRARKNNGHYSAQEAWSDFWALSVQCRIPVDRCLGYLARLIRRL
jgi:hypothetical protein